MTTTSMTDTSTFTVRSAEDFLALAPIMLGYAPADAVAMECFGGVRSFHACAPLPPRRLLDEFASAQFADSLIGPAQQQRTRGVALLFYSDDPDAVDRTWRALRRRAGRAGVEILVALRVAGDRYYPLRGDRRLREIGVAFDLSDHPFRAQAVANGMVTHASRDELVATLAADPTAQAAVADRLAADGHHDRGLPGSAAAEREAAEWARGLVADHVADGTSAAVEDLARLVWLLQVRTVALGVWSLIERANADAYLTFLADVLRRAPDALAAEPAALLAWSAWQAGNGALAWAGVDRCHELDAAHPLAGVVASALQRAVPPDDAVHACSDWAASLSD